MTDQVTWLDGIKKELKEGVVADCSAGGQCCWEVEAMAVVQICRQLQKAGFEQLMDLCVVDYSEYGQSEWQTHLASTRGFSRAVDKKVGTYDPKRRFAVVYHLLSITLNYNTFARITQNYYKLQSVAINYS